MANEVTYQIKISAIKNGTTLTMPLKTFTNDMSGDFPLDEIVTVAYHATDGSAVYIGSAGVNHWIFCQNLDGTNFVELGKGTTSFVPFIKVPPGLIAGPFKMFTSLVLTARADTADCKCRFIIIPA